VTRVAVTLGLAAALAYGTGDFIAGLLSRRISFVAVALVSNAVAWLVMCAVLAATWDGPPTVTAGSWGAASGMGSALGTLALYRGLARGPMGVVAPLSALGAAVIPVAVGVVAGDRPAPAAWAGVALALPAIWLVSTHDSGRARRPRWPVGGIVDGLLAGLGFGLLFVALDRAGDGSGLWPVVAGQATSTVLLAGVAARGPSRADRHGVTRGGIMAAVGVGVLGAAATTCYFLSTHAGMLAIVAVVTSLYPAVTVVLAAVLLRERVRRSQGAGLLLALAAVTLIVLG
jgi:drug/metabolite transporter (DMT)-like permease